MSRQFIEEIQMANKDFKIFSASEDQKYANLITRQHFHWSDQQKFKRLLIFIFVENVVHCFSEHDLRTICIRIIWWVYLQTITKSWKQSTCPSMVELTNCGTATPGNTTQQQKGINCRYRQQLEWIPMAQFRVKEASLKRLHNAWVQTWREQSTLPEKTDVPHGCEAGLGCDCYSRARGSMLGRWGSSVSWSRLHKSTTSVKMHKTVQATSLKAKLTVWKFKKQTNKKRTLFPDTTWRQPSGGWPEACGEACMRAHLCRPDSFLPPTPLLFPLLGKWFSAGTSYAPKGHVAMSGDIFGCHGWGGGATGI